MADAKVNIVGNSDDAQRAVDKLRAQFEKLEDKLKNQAKFSKQAKSAGDAHMQSSIAFAKSLVMNIVSVQAGWELAKKAVNEYMDANKRVQDLRGAVAPNALETEIKITNQGQLSDAETKETIANVNQQASSIPVSDVTDAKRMTEEAFSQGFDRQQIINGEILRAFLELKAATNQYGAGATDAKELVKALATSLRNTEGRDPAKAITAEEIGSFGEAFHSLFLTQAIQLQDAIPFARIQAILSARNIDNKTQLAAFSVAVDAFGGGEVAATYLQQATAYMGRSGSEKMKKKLDKLGINLDGTKFDLIGEDLVEALRNMGEQINALEPRQKADALDALFGTKAQAGALTLMGKADLIDQSRTKIEKATEGGGYQQAIENYRQSAQASSQKKTTIAEIASIQGLKSQGDTTMEGVQKILDATFEEIKKQNASSANLVLDKMYADAAYIASGKTQTPQEYLRSIQVASNDRAEYNIEAGRPNSDAIGTAKILNEQIDKADPRTMQMQVITERLKRESTAAGVESSDLLPQLNIETKRDPRKAEVWNEFDIQKKEIENEVRSNAGWFQSEASIKEEIDTKLKPLYEEYKAKADTVGEIKFPENMQVNDPNLQASVDQLNATMSSVLDVLSINAGPDRQRAIRLPATRGTA